MKRGIMAAVLGLLLLLGIACLASAGELSGPRRDRDYPNDNRYYRDTDSRGGFAGRTFLRLHTGLSMPSGNFDDIANSGWGIGGGIGYGIGRNTILSGGVAFHHFGNEGIGGHTNIVPITASVDYGFNTRGRVRPWVSGGLGLYNVSFEDDIPGVGVVSDSESDFGFNLGFGVAGPLNPNTAWGAGFKYHHVAGNNLDDMNFIALQGGLSFPL